MMTTFYGKQAKQTLIDNCEDYESIEEGKEWKVNHVTCPAGEDTKSRLYVKKVDDSYLWHCHNCGDSGYYRPKDTVKRIKETTTEYVYKDGVVNLGDSYDRLSKQTDIDKMPTSAQLWLSRYGFDQGLTSRYGICYIQGVRGGVVLPTFDGIDINGYQIRTFNTKYKYITYTNHKYSYLFNEHNTNNTLIVTEDLLSSYKLHSAGFSALCLLGTSMSDQALAICKTYDKVVLWLDDDAAGHSSMMKLTKEIAPMCANTTAIISAQPKEHSTNQLTAMEF